MLASVRYIQTGSSTSELLEKIYAAVDSTFYTYPKIYFCTKTSDYIDINIIQKS